MDKGRERGGRIDVIVYEIMTSKKLQEAGSKQQKEEKKEEKEE